MGRAVIVTAIPVEFEAVLSSSRLSNWKTDEQPGGIYRRGKLLETSWEVMLVRSGMGGIEAASATERAIQYFEPDVAFFVGVAGGIKDASLGDVVVADEVLYYEFVKVGAKEKVRVRPKGIPCSFDLVQMAYDEVTTKGWLERLDDYDSKEANALKAFVGTIASGEKLVASRRSTLYSFLRDNFNQALAVEMEGYGFLQACNARKVPGLEVRGISDLLSGKKKADREGYQGLAARNATAFTLQVLSRLGGGKGCLKKEINAPALPANFLPREPDFRKVKDALLSEEKKTIGITGHKVGLQGMGGIGKTVLAAALAKDEDIRNHFSDGIFWLIMGTDPMITSKQSNLAYMIEGESHTFGDSSEGRAHLSSLHVDKPCLIILDDIWRAEDVQTLLGDLGSGSKVLFTTRDARIITALEAQEYRLGLLSEEESQTLLAKWGDTNVDDLPPKAHEIIHECGRLPLALALCGAQVRDGISWNDLLDALKDADLKFLDHEQGSVMKSMSVSIDRLEPDEAGCYTELAVFPPDKAIPEAAVLTLWAYTHELKERDGRKLLSVLNRKSLIQRKTRNGGMIVDLHDLQHDFLKSTCQDIQALHKMLLEAYWIKTDGSWSNGPDDCYFFQYLAYHLLHAHREEDLKRLLFDFNWIRTKLKVTDVTSLISDYDFLSANDELRLVQGAIRLSAHVLSRDSKQLQSQFYGRLMGCRSRQVKALMKQISKTSLGLWLCPLTPSLIASGGPLIRTFQDTNLVRAVAVTPDGKKAISGSDDGKLKVWDLETGKELMTLEGHCKSGYGSVYVVALTPDGTKAVSGSLDKTLKVWDLDTC